MSIREPLGSWLRTSRFDEWMTIFGGWRGPVPSTVEEGTCVPSCVKVQGFRNVIHWKVTRYDEPKSIELQGRGRGGQQSDDRGGNAGGAEAHRTAHDPFHASPRRGAAIGAPAGSQSR